MFAHQNMSIGLKNIGAMFQWAMSNAFYDIKHIVEAYLDDLTTRSSKRVDHLAHICLAFSSMSSLKNMVEPTQMYILYGIWTIIRIHYFEQGGPDQSIKT